MTNEQLTVITALATGLLVFFNLLLFIATRRAAIAAEQNTKIAAREFRLLRRPLVALTWDVPDVMGDTLFLFGAVKEVAGFATTLHSYEVRATPLYDPDTPLVQSQKRSRLLSGDVAKHGVALVFDVPQWYRDGQRKPSTAAKRAPAHQATGNRSVIAELVFKLVISAAYEEAIRDEWELRGMLFYDRTQQCYVLPEMQSAHLGERAPGRRSRIVASVLRAWERWWDSVC